MGRKLVETKRRIFHLILGLFMVFLLDQHIIGVYHLVAVTLIGFALSFLHRKRKIGIIEWILRHFGRKTEEDFPGKGAFFLLVGIILAVSLFPEDIALASIVILSIGDSISPLIGTRFGKIKHPLSRDKVLDASAAGFFLAFMVATLFVSPLEAFIASFLSMMIESVDYVKGRRIEDNVTIPFIAGLSILVLRIFILT
ncbi:MAG: hypothetical protein JW789_05130 [Candidatus Aenigmarchaeota archaeon]|nr:hypothetical protein [Candidatus Aenigmarchaeota archaeon]